MIKELEDYNWFPAILRRWQMDYIGNIATWVKLYRPLLPVLQQMIEKNESASLQDICSGSGIPAVYIHQHLALKIPILLSDKFPDTSFKNTPMVIYSVNSVDVFELQPEEDIIYTMFNAFHHFSAEQQKNIVKKMVENNSPFLITEIVEPDLLTMIKIIFTTTILQLCTAPFVKPFSFVRLFFTYIIPVNLFTVTYDGIISVLKSKTAIKYRELVSNIATNSFKISVTKIKSWKINIVYIKGERVK